MIRINLLPKTGAQARTTAPTSGNRQLWLGIYAAGLAVLVIICGLMYYALSGKVQEQQRVNNELKSEIQQIRARSARLEDAEAKLQASKDLEQVVTELEEARTGPIRVLMELRNLLSVGKGPTIDPDTLEKLRRDNPLAGFNPGWDVRRLWLTSFDETNRVCTITGLGRTNDDVAEFLRRLDLSELFTDVRLTGTKATTDKDTGLELTSFNLTCKVKY